MSLEGTCKTVVSAVGVSIDSTATRNADLGIEPLNVELAAGKDVTSWVKGSASTATCDLPAGHGYGESGTFDVYWSDGLRYGVPGTIATNALTLSGGAGDDFPASATEDVLVCKQEVFDVTFDGDNLVLVAASASRRSHMQFIDSEDATIAAVEMATGEAWSWVSDTGVANPLAGNAVASVVASNGSSAGTSNLKLTGLQYAA